LQQNPTTLERLTIVVHFSILKTTNFNNKRTIFMALWFHNGLIISLMFLTFNRFHKFGIFFVALAITKLQ
jgi:hypothetical protein